MNTILILLVFCFAFFALKQKSEKTRNILLFVSILLGFSMFSVEGVNGESAQLTALQRRLMLPQPIATWNDNGTEMTNGRISPPVTTPVTTSTYADQSCPAGQQWGKEKCESCPELYYKGQGQSSCTKCPIGHTPNLTKTACINAPEDCSSTALECPGYKIKSQGQKCADATCVKSDMGSGGNCCIDPCRDSDCRIGHWLWRGGDKCGKYKACPLPPPPT